MDRLRSCWLTFVMQLRRGKELPAQQTVRHLPAWPAGASLFIAEATVAGSCLSFVLLADPGRRLTWLDMTIPPASASFLWYRRCESGAVAIIKRTVLTPHGHLRLPESCGPLLATA